MSAVTLKKIALAIASVFPLTLIFVFIKKPMKKEPLRVAFNFSAPTKLDPASISNTSQYKLLTNLYGRLVTYDENSQLRADIPESFKIEANKVIFTFGNKVKTPDGHVVTAKDAELSLKRLIVKGKSGHGDIRRFLCPNKSLKNIEDNCEGILSENNQLVLTALKPHYVPMLINALESTDYSIISQNSIRNTELDLNNSTGPYYLVKIREDGIWDLAANQNHYLYSKKMPAQIQLIPTMLMEAEDKFINQEVDLIPSTMPLTSKSLALISSTEAEMHETLPIKVSMIRFSPKAMADFTPEQRRFAGLTVAKYLMADYMEFGAKPTFQFLQSLSGGALTQLEIHENGLDQKDLPRPIFKKPIAFAVHASYLNKVKNDFREFPEIKIVENKAPAFSLPVEERPEIYAMVNDSAWNEDIGFLGFNFENKIFYYPGFNQDKWMTDFLNMDDPIQRNKKVKALQLDMLKSASFVPYTASPYHSLIRKPWKLNQTNIDAGLRLWRIRIE